ncbi:MAG: alpha/beta hydrolase [Clostridia bacterium]|nr:alpha/beta hydrolase [Clostridia bacterium]
MDEKNRIFLWPGDAPYTAFSPGQAQPSLAAYPAPASRGAVVVVPGGGYVMKAEHEGAPIARMLNSQGISAFVLDYRVMPCHRLAPWSDASRAIRLVRSMGYEKVGILGFSAGGNVCCTAATHYDAGDPKSEDPIEKFSSRPDVFVPCYAVASFGPNTHLGSRQSLLGADWENEEIARWYSAEENVTDDTPPAFIWHTSQDGTVPPQNSLDLARALSAHGILYELHIYEKGHHGIGLGAEMGPAALWGSALCRYLLEKGFGA